MQVRWRQYELIFAIGVFCMMACNDLWLHLPESTNVKGLTGTRHFWQLALLPFLLTYGVPLILLILINTKLIPRFLYHPRAQYILPAFGLVAWLLLMAGFALSFKLKFSYLYTQNESAVYQVVSSQSIQLATAFVVLYFLYLCLRETLINWADRVEQKRHFRTLIINRVSGMAFLYTALLFLMGSFDLLRSDGAAIVLLFIVLPLIIVVMINIFGLFPYQHRKQERWYYFGLKLLIAPAVISVVVVFIAFLVKSELLFGVFFGELLILAVVSIPLSWLLFTLQKDRLLTILQLEKDLGKTAADLSFLRSQINPHFLFNTLNTLYGTALQENAGRTATGIQRLGDMMRFLLHDNHRDQIPLSRELEYLQNFMALQQLRIVQSPGISIETSIQACTTDRMIAPMLLIPFVENAYKHGVRLTSPSFIRIHFSCDAKGIFLDVVNSVHPKRTDTYTSGESGVGLANVKQRLQLLYPATHSLSIHQDDAAFEAHLYIELPGSN